MERKNKKNFESSIVELEEIIEKLQSGEIGLEESVEKFKKTVDEIYNSTTWKLASKFTRGQTKRKKN